MKKVLLLLMCLFAVLPAAFGSPQDGYKPGSQECELQMAKQLVEAQVENTSAIAKKEKGTSELGN